MLRMSFWMKFDQISVLGFSMKRMYPNVMMTDDKDVSILTKYPTKETSKD